MFSHYNCFTIALPLEILVTIADCYTTTHYNPQQQQQLLIVVVVVVVQQVVVGRMSDIVHLRELYMVQV
jgi:lipoprotein NlpI